MQRSTERFLTTHTGSLPRADDLVRMMFAKEEGVPVDRAALAARIRSAVAETVRRQAEAGLDVINDGEVSKPSYATYVKDRLEGFGGTSQSLQYQDLVDFPELAKRVFGDPGRARRKAPACTGPIAVRDPQAAQTDVENLRAALGQVNPAEAFLSAASPGVISLFFRNDHYASHEAYLFAIADAMRQEYETVAQAGFILQIDCPDLGSCRNNQYRDLTDDEFRNKIAERNVAALNAATEGLPADRMRLHICWGNYEGPHTHDLPILKIIDIVFKAKVQAISIEAANPRHDHEWEDLKDVKIPDDKILIPGVIDSTTNFVEHPRLVSQRLLRYAQVIDRERLIAGVDCGFGTAVRTEPMVYDSIVWAKLHALSEGAAIASGKLWP